VTGADRLTQTEIGRIASSIQVTFEVIANVPDDCPASAPAGLCLDGKITLKNNGSDLNAGGWTLYYSSIRKVLTSSSPEFTITHINGDLHKIELAPGLTGFRAGETKEIPFQAEFWMMSESDFMPRAYVTGAGLVPASIANTDTEDFSAFVAPLVTPLQTRRHPADQSVIATAGTRFAENGSVRDLGPLAVSSEVVPTPLGLTKGIGILNLQPGVKVNATGISADAVASFKTRLAQLGVRSNDVDGTPLNVFVNGSDPAFSGKSTAEAYTLKIDDTAVTVVGGDAAGAFWGLQTVIGLLPGDIAVNKRLPQVTIAYDSPRYSYRGVQLDLSRNFHGRTEVLKVLDQLAAYKLNTLHVHLGDDEGWRLEIPGLPELTGLGATRCHDLEDKACLMTQLGSGPSTNNSGTGHLTRSDFVQIVRAARARSIEVIPEFDMPGHARAAIKAMEARARAGDTTYRLSDPDDTSVYTTNQNYDDDAINACMDSAYAFVAKVMDEVKAMYADAGVPLKTWHIGGDEVGRGAWTASPICNALYASGGEVKSANDVHGYFMRKVNSLAQARGFAVRGWSDGLRKSVTAPDGSVTKVFLDPATDLNNNPVSANWWGTLFWWDDSVYALANMDYKVILTSPDYLYFDHPYEAEEGARLLLGDALHQSSQALRVHFGQPAGQFADLERPHGRRFHERRLQCSEPHQAAKHHWAGRAAMGRDDANRRSSRLHGLPAPACARRACLASRSLGARRRHRLPRDHRHGQARRGLGALRQHDRLQGAAQTRQGRRPLPRRGSGRSDSERNARGQCGDAGPDHSIQRCKR